MAIVGGQNPDSRDDPDTWPFGLGIFDLSEMRFKDKYDSTAAAYRTPDIVKKWYAENGPIATNSSEGVQNLFAQPRLDSPTTPSPVPPNHKKNIGAIVGGVVGGTLGLVAITAVVWFWRRSRNHRESLGRLGRQPHESPFESRHEAGGNAVPWRELGGQQIHEKAGGAQQYYEVDGGDVQQRRHELYTRGGSIT